MEVIHIGQRIKSCREQKALSVEELAKGISTPQMVELTEGMRGESLDSNSGTLCGTARRSL